MRWLRPLLLAVAASISSAHAATYTWSGAAGDGRFSNPANWVGGVLPPNDGTATVVFTDTGAGSVQLPGSYNLSDIRLENTAAHAYQFNSPLLSFITLHNGLSSDGTGTGVFSGGVALTLASGNQPFDISKGSLSISGLLLGTGQLTKTGSGSLHLSGINLYSGGTRVNEGALIFDRRASIPASGTIQSTSTGYVGVGFNQDVQAYFVNQIDAANFQGSLGLDTLAGQATPAVYSENLNLAALTAFTGLGSTTSARLTGQLTIADGQAYRFSGGAGTLYVESNLSANAQGLTVNSTFGTPLTIVLRGNNSFQGGVSVLNSLLVLDSAHALSVDPVNPAPLNLTGPGYIGFTENFGGTTDSFLSRFGSIASSSAIVGIDSASNSSPRTVTENIDLSAAGTRNDPYYLGTSSRVTLTGQITPTTGDALYLTAVKGGQLTVASTLGSNIPAVVIGQANSFDPQGGSVELKGNNTYAGGTQVLGGTLIAGSNNALGLGGVTVNDRATLNVASAVTVSNLLTLTSGATLSGNGTLASPYGVTISNGAILSPGGNFANGNLTFANGLTFGAGGQYNFNITQTTGQPGSVWDLATITSGALNVTATQANPFVINLYSLTPNNVSGPLSGFNAAQSVSWDFATAPSITGFSSDLFAVNTDNFLSSLNGGSFLVTQNGTSLSLTFTPVPEPSTYALMALGFGLLAYTESRRRRRA